MHIFFICQCFISSTDSHISFLHGRSIFENFFYTLLKISGVYKQSHRIRQSNCFYVEKATWKSRQPVNCPNCNKSITQRKNLNSHLRNCKAEVYNC